MPLHHLTQHHPTKQSIHQQPNIIDVDTQTSSAQRPSAMSIASCVMPSHDRRSDEVHTPRSITVRAITRFLADVDNDLAVQLVTASDHHLLDGVDHTTAAEALRARMYIDAHITATTPGFPAHWSSADITAWAAHQTPIEEAMRTTIADALIDVHAAHQLGCARYVMRGARWYAMCAADAAAHERYMSAARVLDMFDYFTA